MAWGPFARQIRFEARAKSRAQVAAIIEPTLDDLLDEGKWVERDWFGHKLWFFEFDEGILWGATAFMMRELLAHLRDHGLGR